MSLTVKQTGDGEDFPKLQPGKYEGTCFRIVDLGTRDKEFKGEKTKKKELRLEFEITKAIDPADNEINMEDGRPFGVSKTYTASLFEAANLRKDLENRRDKTFNQVSLFGMVTVGSSTAKKEGTTTTFELLYSVRNSASEKEGLFFEKSGDKLIQEFFLCHKGFELLE